MKKKKNRENLLLVAFIIITGIIFCCDVGEDWSDGSVFSGVKSVAEQLLDSDGVEADAADESISDEDDLVLTTAEDGDGELIYVYVCGAVAIPGVYGIEDGARIVDAIESAGGATEDAALSSLNLADLLCDGQKIYVPTEEEAMQSASDTAVSTGDTSSDGLININTATKDELKSLPGIGDAKAEAIIAYRQEHGYFSSIDEITDVSGIGDSIYSQIKSLICVN